MTSNGIFEEITLKDNLMPEQKKAYKVAEEMLNKAMKPITGKLIVYSTPRGFMPLQYDEAIERMQGK